MVRLRGRVWKSASQVPVDVAQGDGIFGVVAERVGTPGGRGQRRFGQDGGIV